MFLIAVNSPQVLLGEQAMVRAAGAALGTWCLKIWSAHLPPSLPCSLQTAVDAFAVLGIAHQADAFSTDSEDESDDKDPWIETH